MSAIDTIKKKALALGACKKIEKFNAVSTIASFVKDPQVLEFCEKQGFPGLADLRDLASEHPEIAKHGIYVDDGVRVWETHTPYYIFAAGNTEVRPNCNRPEQVYNIVLLHGAVAVIEASNYAVVKVTTIGEGCKVEIRNTDQTAIIL